MNRWLLKKMMPLLALVGLLTAPYPVRAAEQPGPDTPAPESELLGVLQNASSSVSAKCKACDQLKRVGTERAIPALAGLLGDEELSMIARTALDTMPYPAAVAALRQGLDKATGQNKAGLIDSLGNHRDKESLPQLTLLLKSTDTLLVSSAAIALGKIGGDQAMTALKDAATQAPLESRSFIAAARIDGADDLLAAGQREPALAIYEDVFNKSELTNIRTAAWRGMIRSADDERALTLLEEGLKANDPARELAVVNALPGLKNAGATARVAGLLGALPPATQIRVLAALATRGDFAATSAIVEIMKNTDPAVRLAAYQALGRMSDPAALLALAGAAAQANETEQEAARAALADFRSAPSRQVVEANLGKVEPAVRLELIRALGAQNAVWAVPQLLDLAGKDADAKVRLASLNALALLPRDESVTGLLAILTGASGADEAVAAQREAAEKALAAACAHGENKAPAEQPVLAALGTAEGPVKISLVRVLPAIGTAPALQAELAATKATDAPLSDAAVRALCAWPNQDALPHLLELARSAKEEKQQVLALRGFVELAGQEQAVDKRLTLLKDAMGAASRTEEQRLILGSLGKVTTPAAFETATGYLDKPELAGEAAVAAVTVAEELKDTEPAGLDAALVKIMTHNPDETLKGRVQALAKRRAFIRSWQMAGPFKKEGVKGPQGYFDQAFAPETPGQPVEWKPIKAATDGTVDLLAALQGTDCAGYLSAKIEAGQECRAALLVGSDDGVKVWLNGQLVHANNVPGRPLQPGQDRVEVTLKQGTNELLLKITQGAMGWGASTQLLGPDGEPLQGVHVVE